MLNFCRGKGLSREQSIALVIVLMGDGIVAFSTLYFSGSGQYKSGGRGTMAMGVILVAASGVLGGIRSILVEAMMQTGGVPEGALLMVEHGVAAVTTFLICFVLALVDGTAALQNVSLSFANL